MLRINAVFASDMVCRDNTRVTPGALLQALKGVWKEGTPSFLSHDLHRPIGWTAPCAVYVEPGLVRLCGSINIADEPKDGPVLEKMIRYFLQSRINDRTAEFERLDSLLGKVKGERVTAECIALWDPGLATRKLPELFQLRDEDGLVPVSELEVIAPGVYRVGEFAVFAHSYLRRGLSPLNSLNGAFLNALQSLPESVKARVALDPDMVGLAESYQWHLEHQYWWGPLFSDNLATITPGVTVHQATEEQHLFHCISRTEFWWQSRKGSHILEVEEIRDAPTFNTHPESVFGCRYAHSIVDEATEMIEHFDGAIRLYSEEEMIERLGVHLPQTGRDKDYTKLWRIDGNTDVHTWKSLLSDYFRDNALVSEYLGADVLTTPIMEEGRTIHPQEDPSRSRLDDLLTVRKGSGPRVSVYFRPLLPSPASCTVVPLRGYDADGHEERFVELPTLDLIKSLRKLGHEVGFDDAIALCDGNDQYYNLPMLWHASGDKVGPTVEALQALTRAWIAEEIDGAISVTLAYPLGETGVAISMRGHVVDVDWLLLQWDRRVQPHLLNPDRLGNSVAELLSEWPTTHDEHATFDSVFQYGILDFPRLLLTHAEVTPTLGADGSLQVRLTLDPESDVKLVDAVERGNLVPRPVWILRNASCTKCGGHYRSCLCSALLDKAIVRIDDARLIQVMLTDRPA